MDLSHPSVVRVYYSFIKKKNMKGNKLKTLHVYKNLKKNQEK